MLPVVVISNKKILKEITNILRLFFTISVISEDEICIDDSSDVLILNTKDIKSIKLYNGVLILSDFCDINFREFACSTIIADGNRSFVRGKIDGKTQYITCGMNVKDTVSFSSIDIDEVTVSLMREVKKISGENAEPFEISVSSKMDISNYSPFSILSAIATATILGATFETLE